MFGMQGVDVTNQCPKTVLKWGVVGVSAKISENITYYVNNDNEQFAQISNNITSNLRLFVEIIT